jgi:hypothetical protein
MFEALIKFKKAHGHCNVPIAYPDNPKLANWVKTQRTYWKKGILKTERLRRLEKIGFIWTLREMPTWDAMFYELFEFRKRYGHCEVPYGWPEDPKLANWVANQRRRRYKNDAVGKERVKRLEEIGFRWQVAPYWEDRFSELARFKNAHGHCDVTPPNRPEDLTLRNWVKLQRARRKEGRLSKNRVERLDKLGFVWNRSYPTWEKMFSLLLQYKKEHGNCDVPNVWPENPPLGRWVSSQRYLRKKNKLKEDRVRRLVEIGFRWQLRERAAKGG